MQKIVVKIAGQPLGISLKLGPYKLNWLGRTISCDDFTIFCDNTNSNHLEALLLDTSNSQYESITRTLEQNNILADGAEIHGIICGMLCAGMLPDNQEWLDALGDFVNQGESFAPSVKEAIKGLYDLTCQQLVETDFSLSLCLPDDAAPINDRGQALVKWVQGFMLGFGIHQADLTACSDDVKEALEDFSEISRMDEAMEEDEDSERALFEVLEYVRITSMLCFNELGRTNLEQSDTSKTVH